MFEHLKLCILAVGLVAVVATVGCKSDDKGSSTPKCVPNVQARCICPDGLSAGMTTCLADGTYAACMPCAGGVAGTGVAGSGIAGSGFAGTGFAGTGFGGTGVAGTGVAGTGVAGTGVAGSGVAGSTGGGMGGCAVGEACQTFGGFKYCAPPGSIAPPSCATPNMACGASGQCIDGTSLGFPGAFCITPNCM